MRELARRLRQRREQMQLTQAEVTKETGIAASVVSHYESGRRVPSLENAVRIGHALGISLDWLTGKDAGASPPEDALEAKIRRLGKVDRGLVERLVDGLMRERVERRE